jgi:hypothetical protein
MMMKAEVGEKTFPIWLLGDSNPKNWEDKLDFPLDPRHPARHSIWTPILDVIQQEVFLVRHTRIDMSNIFVRNAIQKSDHKPKDNIYEWKDVPVANSSITQDLVDLRTLTEQYMPKIVFTFGSFAFEFARRSIERADIYHPYRYWNTKLLGQDFRKRIENFEPKNVNILPLLHATIARGRFLESHRDFCAGEDTNYFSFTGKRIGQLLLRHYDEFDFWMK